jgi:pyridoxine 4-dehydrogenase
MPQIIPLPGASTVERVEENSKEVVLNDDEMAAIDDILTRMPVQGHRWPPMLQAFEDK